MKFFVTALKHCPSKHVYNDRQRKRQDRRFPQYKWSKTGKCWFLLATLKFLFNSAWDQMNAVPLLSGRNERSCAAKQDAVLNDVRISNDSIYLIKINQYFLAGLPFQCTNCKAEKPKWNITSEQFLHTVVTTKEKKSTNTTRRWILGVKFLVVLLAQDWWTLLRCIHQPCLVSMLLFLLDPGNCTVISQLLRTNKSANIKIAWSNLCCVEKLLGKLSWNGCEDKMVCSVLITEFIKGLVFTESAEFSILSVAQRSRCSSQKRNRRELFVLATQQLYALKKKRLNDWVVVGCRYQCNEVIVHGVGKGHYLPRGIELLQHCWQEEAVLMVNT